MWYSVIGLCLDIAGVAILFYWGPPPSWTEGGMAMVVSRSNDPKENAAWERDAKVGKFMSWFAFVLLILGFLGQLTGTLVQGCSK